MRPPPRPPDQLRLTDQELDVLFVHLLRCPPVRFEARSRLTTQHFDATTRGPYRLLLDVIYTLDTGPYHGNELPFQVVYSQTVYNNRRDGILDQAQLFRLLATPDDLQSGQIVGLLYAAYHEYPAEQLVVPYALDLLQRWLRERAYDRLQQELVMPQDRFPGAMPGIIESIQTEFEAAEAFGKDPFSSLLPADWQPKPLIREPSGCDFIDKMMGGHVRRDANGIIGLFGGGKTTLGSQIVTRCGALYQAAATRGEPLRHSIYVTYEEPEHDIRTRMLVAAAQIPKPKFEEITSWDQLTRAPNLDPYERQMYEESGVPRSDWQGEYERLVEAGRLLTNVHIVDMRAPGRGIGWVDELSAMIERKRQMEGWQIGVVVIDYVNAMVRRYLHQRNLEYDRHLRHYIGGTPLRCKELIAERFDCCTWLLQQFTGEANKRKPGVPMSHAEAGEAKNFAENLVFCLAFGAIDPHRHVVRVDYTKARRRGIQGMSAVLKHNGDFQRFDSADDYTISGSEIIQREHAELAGHLDVPPPPPVDDPKKKWLEGPE